MVVGGVVGWGGVWVDGLMLIICKVPTALLSVKKPDERNGI